MINKALYSSAKGEWATPDYFFRALHAEFGFSVDVCATAENAKCANYYTPDQDGLKQDWAGTVWLNPPYGKGIYEWISKAYQSYLDGATVVCLVPCRPDTRWYQDFAPRAEVRLYRGRLKFGESKNSAPFPSAIMIFSRRVIPGAVRYVGLPRMTATTAYIADLFTEDSAA